MRLRNDHREERKIEGAKRNEAWQALSTTEKIKVLDTRLGVEQGAKRQRAKLAVPEAQ